MVAGGWQLDLSPSRSVPAQAWLLAAKGRRARLVFGHAVRPTGVGIVEGTWTGEGGALGPLHSTTVFGSAVVVDHDLLYLIPPGHMLECIYLHQRADEVLASNSLSGLLVSAGRRLDGAIAYPALFNRSVEGEKRLDLPVMGGHIRACLLDRVAIRTDGSVLEVACPQEAPFVDFADYRRRLSAALRTALTNAPQGAQPVVTISSGYDGAAVAVLASELGCQRAVSVVDGRPALDGSPRPDSGASIAQRLGMDLTTVERLAYQRQEDLIEADFLASGFSGEEAYLSDAQDALEGNVLVSAFLGDGMWWIHRPPRADLWRSDQSGSSLGEWRLRVGFSHVPLPFFGAIHHRALKALSRSSAMRPWVVGGRYDKPIPRRILEEAGIARGTFGTTKTAASADIHVHGPRALAPATQASVARFAAAEGRRIDFRPLPRPAPWRRVALKVARSIHAEKLAFRLERARLQRSVAQPEFGSLLLRWAISVVEPRYRFDGHPAPPADVPELRPESARR